MIPAPSPPIRTRMPKIVAITLFPPNFFLGVEGGVIEESISNAGAAEPPVSCPALSTIGGAGGKSEPSTGGGGAESDGGGVNVADVSSGITAGGAEVLSIAEGGVGVVAKEVSEGKVLSWLATVGFKDGSVGFWSGIF